MIAVNDIGRFGAAAFERHEQLNGRAIELAGDAMTMPQAAEVLGRTMGRAINFFQVPIDQVRAFSDDFARMLEWFDRVGYEADVAELEREFGFKPQTFAEWATVTLGTT